MLSSRCQSLPSMARRQSSSSSDSQEPIDEDEDDGNNAKHVKTTGSHWKAPKALSCDDITTPLFAEFSRRSRSLQALAAVASSSAVQGRASATAAASCPGVADLVPAQAPRHNVLQVLECSAASAIMATSVDESEALRRLTCTWSMSSACLQTSDEVPRFYS